MADLHCTYLGLPLASPLVVAATPITMQVDNLELAQRFGAGAVVLRSLFEEQILAEQAHMEDMLSVAAEAHAEAQSYFPPMNHADAAEYLRQIERSKKAVEIPVIASLNAVRPGSWTRYAKQVANAGADALELNVYAVATDLSKTSADIEAELYAMLAEVLAAVSIPVSVKLSSFYTAAVNVVGELDKRGAAGVVLFNRFLQPNIDPDQEQLDNSMPLSTPNELRLPLRYAALLYKRIACDVAISTGVHSGTDLARSLLAGATVAQVGAAIIKNGMHHIGTMLRDLESWMDERSYDSLDTIRGKLSQAEVSDPFAFERAQYVSLLMNSSQGNPLNARVN